MALEPDSATATEIGTEQDERATRSERNGERLEPEEDRDAGLAAALSEILFVRRGLDGSALETEVGKLAQSHGARVYSELIYLLSHVRLRHETAKHHWQQILEHRAFLEERLGSFVDVRVAVASYFVQADDAPWDSGTVELRLFERAPALAYRDELTGLGNRRYFSEFLEQEIRKAGRARSPLSLVLADVDDMSWHNDRLGREGGDAILIAVARLLSESVRQEDMTARPGTGEFALILPATPKIAAQRVAERGRARVEGHAFPGGTVTISMGVATFPADAIDAADLQRCADRALYTAKVSGKNRVRLFGQDVRSYPRLDARLPGTYQILGSDSFALTTLNVSEGGLLFLTDKQLPEGALLEIALPLPAGGRRITATGRVVHVQECKDGRYQVAIHFVEMPTRDRFHLASFVSAHRVLFEPKGVRPAS